MSIKPGLGVRLTDGERQYIEAVIARCGGSRIFRAKKCWKNAEQIENWKDIREHGLSISLASRRQSRANLSTFA